MGVYEDAPEGYLRLRFQEALADLKDFAKGLGAVEVKQAGQAKDIEGLREDITALNTGLERINATLNKLLVGITGSALIVAASVMTATRIWG